MYIYVGFYLSVITVGMSVMEYFKKYELLEMYGQGTMDPTDHMPMTMAYV